MKKKTEMKTNIEWLKDIEWLKREIKEINLYTLHTSTLQKKMLDLIDQLDKPETLSQKWIDEHKQHITRHSADKDGIGQYHSPPVVSVYDLQNLLVSKREELTDEQIAKKVDQAYKDGYEKGKEHATREGETETVASVMADYFRAEARLKEALNTKVEELE